MKALIETFESIIHCAISNSKSINISDFEAKSNEHQWSKKEILGHLIDSAMNNYRRFMLASSQDDLVFEGYDQTNWVLKNKYQSRDIKELFQLWTILNLHLNALMAAEPFELVTRKTTVHNFHEIGMNPIEEGVPSSMAYLFWDYLFHLEHHLTQIFPEYKRILKSKEEYRCI